MLGKLLMPGRPTNLDTVGQEHTALAVGANGDSLNIFSLVSLFFFPLSGKRSDRDWNTVSKDC